MDFCRTDNDARGIHCGTAFLLSNFAYSVIYLIVQIWDQRTPHGAICNDSDRCRYVQFIKMYPRSSLEANIGRRERRRETLRGLVNTHLGRYFKFSQLSFSSLTCTHSPRPLFLLTEFLFLSVCGCHHFLHSRQGTCQKMV